jgi:hypothetical protein
MNAAALDFQTIDALTSGKLGRFDLACPICGPSRHSPLNQRRPVLRVWRPEPGFASFYCARCEERGHVHDWSTAHPRPDRRVIERIKAEADARERATAVERTTKARWAWSRRQPIAGTIAETYLRTARGYRGPLPSTLGYLPPRGVHGPAMIAAFGLPAELELGELCLDGTAVCGIHLTRLLRDGSDRERGDKAKIMIGSSAGYPIVVAPANDLLGLCVAEGIEDALSIHEVTGLGAWAAGSASRMPALAAVLPSYIEVLNIAVDDDEAGQRHAGELAARANARGFSTRLLKLGTLR